MAYRDNVQKLADARGIPNPLQESTISLGGMKYWTDEGFEEIMANAMNRGIRLFLQVQAEALAHPATGSLPSRLDVNDELLRAAAEFFDELWLHEPGTGTHKNLDALRATRGRVVELYWR